MPKSPLGNIEIDIEPKSKIISIETLTEPTDKDNDAQKALKKVFTAYYIQTPHRKNDELEKSQLLDQLKRLA